jgi:hypothetical protein
MMAIKYRKDDGKRREFLEIAYTCEPFGLIAAQTIELLEVAYIYELLDLKKQHKPLQTSVHMMLTHEALYQFRIKDR